MGTRCLTVFKNASDKEIVVLYRQGDGYMGGHGKELAEFLAEGKIVNGFSMDEKRKVFNGMECLTAQVISHFKKEIGNFYLYPAETRGCGEDYLYIVTGKVGQEPHIECYRLPYEKPHKLITEGSASEVLEYISNNCQRRGNG